MNGYSKYKPSGIDWIGDIPEHWEVTRIKRINSSEENSFVDGDWIETPFIEEEGIRLIQTGNIGIGNYKEQGYKFISESTFNELNCKEIFPGDVLICRLASPVGRACLAPSLSEQMITSVDVCILKPNKKFTSKYIVYFLSNDGYLDFLDQISRGSTRDRISRTQLGQIEILQPPVEEQISISEYLDDQALKIDTLISNKKSQIEKLKELRQIEINNAVTKGLNPIVEMKESGVEWLEEIPKHWDLKRLKNIGKVIGGFAFPSPMFTEEGIKVLKITNIQTMSIIWDDNEFIPKELLINYTDFLVSNGDLVFALTRPIISTGIKAAIINSEDEEILLNQRTAVFKPSSKILSSFLYFIAMSNYFYQDFQSHLKITNQPNISTDDISIIKIAIPSIEEQKQITLYLHQKTFAITKAIENLESQIQKLEELRKIKIYEAVTGKIKILKKVEEYAET